MDQTRKEKEKGDRRASERISITLPVLFDEVEALSSITSIDISRVGIFLKTPFTLPLNTLINFWIFLPSGDDWMPIYVKGRIVHLLNDQDSQEKESEPGMGIELIEIPDPEDKSQWDELLARFL